MEAEQHDHPPQRPVPIKLPSIQSLLNDIPSTVTSPTSTSSSLFAGTPTALSRNSTTVTTPNDELEQTWETRPQSQAGPPRHRRSSQPDLASIRRHRNARACDECRRRKIRCSKASEGDVDDDSPCENCAKSGVPCAFGGGATEQSKGIKYDWQPPKTAFSRPNTQSFTQGHAFPLGSRPATSSAAYYPPSATLGQAGGYGPTFTSSAESLRRMSGATASSLSVLSSAPSYGSPTSSLFAFTPPMEPVVRVANLATTLASTTLQQTFCTFSHETVFSEGMPLHVAAAAVQRQARCGQETIAQSVGLALLGDRQSSMTDSDALVLFYYDQFRRGRVGSELLMAACLKVGQLPPSPERDRRSVALSLLAAVHSMGYATQRPLMPYPSLGTDASLTLLQTSALSTPTLQSLEILKASLRVFGGGETPEVDHRTSSISDTTKCMLRFRSLYYRLCFLGREQKVQQSDETALLAEARELCDMMPLVNHSMFLPHVMGLVATTLALLQLQNTKGRIEGGEELIKSLAHVILDAHFTAEGLQVLLERIQEFVRVIVLDPTAMPSEAASGPLYLRMWLSSGYLGQIDRIMGGK